MTNIPKKVRIGPYDWKIVDMPHDYMMSMDRVGECSPLEQEIRVYPKMTQARQASVLIHEMLHAIWFTSRMDIVSNEEDWCRVTEMAWSQIMRDNPKVMNWIGENLRK